MQCILGLNDIWSLYHDLTNSRDASYPRAIRADRPAAAASARQRARLDNFDVVNAILFVAANGRKWWALPSHHGNWHTIDTRVSGWSKAGVLEALFKQLARRRLMLVRIEAVSFGPLLLPARHRCA